MELNVIEPRTGCKFYNVVVEVLTEDEKGKVKKTKFKHLVDAVNPTEVEKKVAEYMGLGTSDYQITNIQLDKIISVF